MNKRIAIYGSTGMLGHMVYDHLRQLAEWDVYAMPRSCFEYVPTDLLNSIMPEIVINCAGIVKQAITKDNKEEAIKINTLLPYLLNEYCRRRSVKYIHFSTDCVIANDSPDMTDDGHLTPSGIYRFSKSLGEPCDPNAITFRTSFIGREFHSNNGLFNWLMMQTAGVPIKGYTKAIFSGTTNLEIATIIRWLVSSGNYEIMSGIYNITGERISKFDLLGRLNAAYGLKLTIIPDDSVVVDRSLDPTRFVNATSFEPASWDNLISDYQDYYHCGRISC